MNREREILRSVTAHDWKKAMTESDCPDGTPQTPCKRIKLEDQESAGRELNASKTPTTEITVNEIALDGQVVQLERPGMPSPSKLDDSHTVDNAGALENGDEEETRRQLCDLIGEETFSSVQLLFEQLINSDKDQQQSTQQQQEQLIPLPAINDKQARSRVHQLCRALFGTRLVSETKTVDDENCNCIIIIRPRTASDRNSNAAPIPPYTLFHLRKENRESFECINTIAKHLRMASKQFTVAGTKDKRGITVQQCCVHRVSIDRLVAISGRLRGGLTIGDFRYSKQELRVGDLKGNRFLLCLRNILPDRRNVVEQRLQLFKHQGFINYFGLQRFGTHQTPTHHIGRAVLRGEWEEAVNLILGNGTAAANLEFNTENIGGGGGSYGDRSTERQARQLWLAKDIKRACELMPGRCVAEKALLQSLSKNAANGSDRNWRTAFDQIPRNLRYMYESSYQSFVWNTMASLRIRLYGLQVVPGDLIQTDADARVVLVECQQQDCSRYDIADVVLPLPGLDVEYPQNDVGIRYRELLRSDGVLGDGQKALPGCYRPLIVRPSDVDWQFRAYSDPDEQISWDSAAFSGGENDDDGKSLTALLVAFNLPSSSYATMALRELMRFSTERQLHSAMSAP